MAHRRRKAKTAEAARTAPLRLSQLPKICPRGVVSRAGSVIQRLLLLSEGAHVSDQLFHFLLTQFVSVGVHLLFALLNDALLDDFKGVLVLHFGLDLGIGVVFDAALTTHLGIALAVGSVAFHAMGFPVRFEIGSRDRGGSDYCDYSEARFQ